MFGMSLDFLGLRDGMDSWPSVVGHSGHVWDMSLGFPGQWDGMNSGIGALCRDTPDMSWDPMDEVSRALHISYSVGLYRNHPTIIL